MTKQGHLRFIAPGGLRLQRVRAVGCCDRVAPGGPKPNFFSATFGEFLGALEVSNMFHGSTFERSRQMSKDCRHNGEHRIRVTPHGHVRRG